MDIGTEDALKAIITGIQAAEATGTSLSDSIANALNVASLISRDANDPVTAGELARLAAWARSND